MRKHAGRWLFVGAAALAVASVLVFRISGPELRPAGDPGDRLASPAARVVAELDQRIGFHSARAARGRSAWLDFEQVARAYLRRARVTGSYDDYAHADRALAEAFSRAPPGAGPFFTRAQLSYVLHRLDRVRADLHRARRTVLKDGALTRAIEEMEAALLFQGGAYRAAEEAYRRLLDERRTVTVLARLAQYRWKTGEVARAEALLGEAEERTPRADLEGRAWLRLVRGLIDLEFGRHREALAHYREADAVFGGWYLVEEHIAEVLALRGRLREAQDRYRALVRKTQNPEFMDALAGVSQTLGDHAESRRMAERATALYEARLARFPEASFGHALDHYLAQGDAQRAVELAEKNHVLRPNAEAATKLARAYQLAGRSEDARRAVRLALATPWSTPELHETADAILTVPSGTRPVEPRASTP